jgi:serine/threonine-protein kinase
MAFNELYAMKEFYMRGVNMRNGNNVTVSVPDNHDSYESQKEKFKKEAIRLRNLHNKHIVRVHDLFEENGTVYYVMDFIDGRSLADVLKQQGPMSEAEARKMLEQLLLILDAVRRQGLTHMDIKPSNILMEQGRNVRLMDLGIADVTDTVNSATSGMMGTPKYAAPEQFSSAEAKPQLTAATDIYEAGVTLYELLTAYNPFNANTVAEAREMHLETILEKRGGLSDSVYAVIRKATAINPKERYQSAAAMKMDLKQALIAPPPTDRRWMYIAGAAIGAIAILIIILLLIL